MKWIYFTAFLLLSACSGNGERQQVVIEKTDTAAITETRREIAPDTTNPLTAQTEDLELEYILWGCACANWITPADKNKYQDSGIAPHCIFIEPDEPSLNIPENFDPVKQRIKIKGHFYLKKGYPKGTIEGEEQMEKAKVFRYTQFTVISGDAGKR